MCTTCFWNDIHQSSNERLVGGLLTDKPFLMFFPSGISEFTPAFSGVHDTWSFVFCVVFCSSFFGPFVLFCWSLCCLFFFDLRILMTPLVYLNSSYYDNLHIYSQASFPINTLQFVNTFILKIDKITVPWILSNNLPINHCLWTRCSRVCQQSSSQCVSVSEPWCPMTVKLVF